MKCEIPFRIIVTNPLAGVTMMVQKGKVELLPPGEKSAEKLVFDFDLTVDLAGDSPNFLGKFAQGPKNERFIYVNSGTYALPARHTLGQTGEIVVDVDIKGKDRISIKVAWFSI